MGNYKVSARKESTIARELTIILNREIPSPVLSAVSISEVRLTNDNEVAKVYYSFIAFTNSGIDADRVAKELENYNKKIRKMLAAKLKMRAVPELHFIYDTSLDNANRIEQILKETKK